MTIQPFTVAVGDPLSAEHAVVSQWVDESLAGRKEYEYSRDVPLKSTPAGVTINDAKGEAAKRYVMAALAQAVHYDGELARVRSQAKSENERVNSHHLPGWNAAWGRRRRVVDAMTALMKRTLPYSADDVLALVSWSAVKGGTVSSYWAPLGAIGKAAERLLASGEAVPPPLTEALQGYTGQLRQSHDKSVSRLATPLEQAMTAAGLTAGAAAVEDDGPAVPVPPPTAGGDPLILAELKRALSLAGASPASAEPTVIGPDQFPLPPDSRLKAEHGLLTELFQAVVGQAGYHRPALESTKPGEAILSLGEAGRGRVLLAAAERATRAAVTPTPLNEPAFWQSRSAADGVIQSIIRSGVALDRAGTFDFALFAAARGPHELRQLGEGWVEQAIADIERWAAEAPLSDAERYAAHVLRTALVHGPPLGVASAPVARLTAAIRDRAVFVLVPGEAWTDTLNADVAALPRDRRQQWFDLFAHLLTATAARPTDKWLAKAEQLVEPIGRTDVAAAVERWFPLVSRGRSAVTRIKAYDTDVSTGDLMHEENATALRGLLWIVDGLNVPGVARLIANVAMSAYRKVPGRGPRAVKVGNGAIYALSRLNTPDAVGQLAMLKVRVKFGTAQKEVGKAFDAAAAALNVPRDEIEELGVPAYGLEEVGVRREQFGEFTAELRVDGRDVAVHWSDAAGKPRKSVPATVKAEHKESLKELTDAAKDIAAMLPTQAERLDALFLVQKKWPAGTWRERYLDHPLVGTLARRLIWVDGNGTSFCWLDGQLVDVADQPVTLADDATVALWHPIGRPTEETLAWRAWLERHAVRQPFKQAHREVYILTDAERRTNSYSNRFAGHVLRQHQFNALTAARGWRNKLRLMVDDTYPPATRELPQWGLRAEYWIEGAGDEYGVDTADSGAYLRLTTDQVRFYRIDATGNYAHAGGGGYENRAAGPGTGNVNEPLPLEQVPPLALSEVMRDVDLFVGVGSVGNDPTWQDGGPGGRYRTYWQSYSFGELSATAQTRAEVLGKLVPRLKIAAACKIDGRFLVVRGTLRTYKIHLGSGNILMEPNDQYLCIVPSRSTEVGGAVFLPFEGDGTLSVILSKAFLLAADDKITDTTITRQIKDA